MIKRLNIISDQANFIGTWIISNDNLFENLINYFEKNSHLQKQGLIGGGDLNLNKKKSTDITIDPSNLKNKEYLIFNQYISELFNCYNDYKSNGHLLKKNSTQ